MESNIDIISKLRIKPLPSTNKVYDFFLAKNVEKEAKLDVEKEDIEDVEEVEKDIETVIENFPPIIDKTDEELIDYEKFMKNLVEKTLINKKDLVHTEKTAIKDLDFDYDYAKNKKFVNEDSIISNIIKTTEKIFIVDSDAKYKKEPSKLEEEPGKLEEPIKEIKTKAKKLINDDDENIDLDKYYDLDSIINKKIGTNSIQERLKDKIKYDEDLKINISPYYLYNREIYIILIICLINIRNNYCKKKKIL